MQLVVAIIRGDIAAVVVAFVTGDVARLGLAARGAGRFVHTDIARDGTLEGPNVVAMRTFAETLGDSAVIASGGVSNVGDVRSLAGTGVEGVIVGRALYTGALTLPGAIEAAASA